MWVTLMRGNTPEITQPVLTVPGKKTRTAVTQGISFGRCVPLNDSQPSRVRSGPFSPHPFLPSPSNP
jgi:hypothetical protein